MVLIEVECLRVYSLVRWSRVEWGGLEMNAVRFIRMMFREHNFVAEH